MPNGRHIIAIVEGDPDDRILFREAFEECLPSLKIDFLESGPDLLDYLYGRGRYAGSPNRPNLVMMTLDLPNESGFQAISEIKTSLQFRRLPLIALIDSVFERDMERCYELGANTVISKPAEYAKFVQIMRSVCDFWFTIARS